MTREEFAAEMVRLYRGFNAEESLTPEKVAALHQGLDQYAIGQIRDAVTDALREPRLPSFNRLADWAEAARESDQEQDRRRFQQQAEERLAQLHAKVGSGWVPDAFPAPPRPVVARGFDGGAWLRVNGIDHNLWPPAYCSEAVLQSMDWPWPEWPATLGEFRMENARRRDPRIARQFGAGLPPANEEWFRSNHQRLADAGMPFTP